MTGVFDAAYRIRLFMMNIFVYCSFRLYGFDIDFDSVCNRTYRKDDDAAGKFDMDSYGSDGDVDSLIVFAREQYNGCEKRREILYKKCGALRSWGGIKSVVIAVIIGFCLQENGIVPINGQIYYAGIFSVGLCVFLAHFMFLVFYGKDVIAYTHVNNDVISARDNCLKKKMIIQYLAASYRNDKALDFLTDVLL